MLRWLTLNDYFVIIGFLVGRSSIINGFSLYDLLACVFIYQVDYYCMELVRVSLFFCWYMHGDRGMFILQSSQFIYRSITLTWYVPWVLWSLLKYETLFRVSYIIFCCSVTTDLVVVNHACNPFRVLVFTSAFGFVESRCMVSHNWDCFANACS